MFVHHLIPNFVCPNNRFLIFEGEIEVIRRTHLPLFLVHFENLKIKNDDNSFGSEFKDGLAFLGLNGIVDSRLAFAIVHLFDNVKPGCKYRGYLDLSASGLNEIQLYSMTHSETLKAQLKEMFFELTEITTEEKINV